VNESSGRSGTSRLVDACEASLARLVEKESAGIDPDVFAEVGEVLFWLYALAEENRKNRWPLFEGLRWARDRMAHGVMLAKPAEWHYGTELGRWVLGRGQLGTTSGHEWLQSSGIPQSKSSN
jgi:hypothetical protein